MLQRTAYPAGVPCWVDTAQPDVVAAKVVPAGGTILKGCMDKTHLEH
jgi:hypothetical protein